MNELNAERAYDAFSRFRDDHPNLDPQGYTAEVLRINKRFGVTSILPIIKRLKEKREALQADIAALSKPHQAAVNSLLELSVAQRFSSARPVLPFEDAPVVFRAAVAEGKRRETRTRILTKPRLWNAHSC